MNEIQSAQEEGKKKSPCILIIMINIRKITKADSLNSVAVALSIFFPGYEMK